MEKKAKAEAKRLRRINRKQGGDVSNQPVALDGDPEAMDGDPQTIDGDPQTPERVPEAPPQSS